MPRISIIIPVYGVEEYLHTCVDSVLRQTIADIEVILVDDGSPDKCGEICDQYAKTDSRIKVFHQRNQGVSAARNAGMEIADGDYWGFVDPDDFVSADMYETLVQNAERENADIAICGFSNCDEEGKFLNDSAVPEGVLSRDDMIASIYGMPNVYHGSMCNKIFKRDLIKNLRFDRQVAIGEDWLLLFECYKKATKAVAVKMCGYSIRNRNNSATRKSSTVVYVNKLKAYLKLYEYSKQFSKDIKRKAIDKILDTCTIIKKAIKEQDHDRKSLNFVNGQFRRIAVYGFFSGRLSLKRCIYYILEGFRY